MVEKSTAPMTRSTRQGLHRRAPGGLHRRSQRRAAEIVAALLEASPESGEVWRRHEIDVTHHHDLKRYLHPGLGELEMYAKRLVDPDAVQELLVVSANPAPRAMRNSSS